MTEFHGQCITLAAAFNGWSLKGFAARAGIGDSTIYGLTRGTIPFSEQLAAKLSYASGLPVGFFATSGVMLDASDLTFRRKRAMKVSEENRIASEFTLLAGATHVLLRSNEMLDRTIWLDAIAPRNKPSSADIERIARDARTLFDIGNDSPVNNVMRSFERHGIPCVPMQSPSPNGEGVTSPTVPFDVPIIGFSKEKRDGAGMRFTIAHEGGHLILQRFRTPDELASRETEAHAFASAFLLPEREARALLRPSMTLMDFIPIKARWGISIAALIMRGSRLGIFDNDKQRSLMMQLSGRGWRRQEPVSVPKESPILMRQLIGATYGKVLSATQAQASRSKIENGLRVPGSLAYVWADGIQLTS